MLGASAGACSTRPACHRADAETLGRRVVAQLSERGPFSLAPVINGDRRRAPHEPRPRAAVVRPRWRGSRAWPPATRISSWTSRARRAARATTHVDGLLRRLAGAEASLVVNNNAAAVLLALEVARARQEVVVSRGELIEIGGAFRIPDIMARSGARLRRGRHHQPDAPQGLRERDHARDGAAPQGASLELPRGGLHRERRHRGAGGAGARARRARCSRTSARARFLDLRRWGLPREPTVPESVAAGADLVTFSGDKLLGGPQAGIVVGRRALVERLQQNPLNRALRIDKLTLAALEATLYALRGPATGARDAPDPPHAERAGGRRASARGPRAPPPARPPARPSGSGRAERAPRSEAARCPTAELPTAALALGTPGHPAMTLDARLRAGAPPVIGRVADDRSCWTAARSWTTRSRCSPPP